MSISYADIPGSIESNPAESRNNRRLKTQQRHAALIDEIERGLSHALQDYRYHAEEVLASFLVELEKNEAAHDLEVAKLRAENEDLRARLGLKDAPELFQSVLFGQSENQRYNAALHKIRNTDNIASSKAATSDKAMAKMRRPEQHGGSWQCFVAWVPNGAALKSPEPWKPLPPSDGPLPCLPGMVEELKDSKKRGKDEDEDSSDSEEEPEPCEVLDVWKLSQKVLERMRKAADVDNSSHNSGSHREKSLGGMSAGSSGSETESLRDNLEEKPWFLVHPDSMRRMLWDSASLAMVIFDMVMIPLSAFNLPASPFLVLMDWTTRLFWTLDMGWSSLTGVVLPNAKISFEIKYILKRYLKTWFTLDFLLVAFDWMEELVSSTNIIGLGRMARAFRIARVVRLLRLVRMQEVLTNLSERIQSDKLAFIFMACKLLVFVLSASHVLACVWWWVGDVQGLRAWPSTSGVETLAVGEQYLVSLHWALTQLTGGMDEIMPANALERFCAVVAWVFGFTVAAVICSIMTSNLTHAHIIGGAQSRQMATLRQYLKQNAISRNLALRVQRSAQHAVTADLQAESVEMLALVAEPLRIEMNFEMYHRILANHPMFSDWISADPGVVRRVCHNALTMSQMAMGDVVFSRGETPRQPKMFFVVKGLLEYTCRGKALFVGERQWIAEACLWTTWTHRGTLTATTEVKMALLDATMFQEIAQRFRSKKHFDPRLYVAEFVDHLNKTAKADDLTFLPS